MTETIAFFGLIDGAARSRFGQWENHLARLAAAVVERSEQRFVVDLVAVGSVAGRELLAPGVWLSVLPACGPPRISSDATSWALATYLDGVNLAHIHAAATGLCETALLLCAWRGIPVCLTQNALPFESLFTDLGLVHLADAVVCHSAAVARRLPRTARVSILPSTLGDEKKADLADGLAQLYLTLLAPRGPAG